MNIHLQNGFSLTEIRRSDGDALVEWLNDREIYERTLRIPYPYTAAAAEFWFGLVEQGTAEHGRPVNWAIRDATGKLVGSIGLEGVGVSGRKHRGEVGYWLARPYWGRGIMPAAVRAVCRHAFDDMGLRKIIAHTFAGNDASARVLEKCGFVQEGFLRAHFEKDGRLIDVRLFGLMRVPTADAAVG
jgi:[ribosomal protein S5]-alanine N-acetyltransferase